MVWTILGIILGVLSVLSLVLGMISLFNKEDYSFTGSRSYNNMSPFMMTIVYGILAYIMFTVK
ncbi:hypothetical protein CJP46_02485 [Paenibacillus sp. XY044]|nr:hypothetical protein CJP46_02485 [Paenibacillus sp. XY044]